MLALNKYQQWTPPVVCLLAPSLRRGIGRQPIWKPNKTGRSPPPLPHSIFSSSILQQCPLRWSSCESHYRFCATILDMVVRTSYGRHATDVVFVDCQAHETKFRSWPLSAAWLKSCHGTGLEVILSTSSGTMISDLTGKNRWNAGFHVALQRAFFYWPVESWTLVTKLPGLFRCNYWIVGNTSFFDNDNTAAKSSPLPNLLGSLGSGNT